MVVSMTVADHYCGPAGSPCKEVCQLVGMQTSTATMENTVEIS